MGAVLQRIAFSPNIKERKDFSCALFNGRGEMIAMLMLNDPYRGGTHLPDVTLIAPVYYKGKLLFYVANRAHHSDVGGMSAGSMPLSTMRGKGILWLRLLPTRWV